MTTSIERTWTAVCPAGAVPEYAGVAALLDDGVQDSVGLAIELELRYRGLRSPHKLKSGVSGCPRECAEARSKDFGIIATENGWNLYVGGNGGTTPRHAELLVSDVDSETLIRTIDRFLMFYVRTADRLQRTAPWIEELRVGSTTCAR